MSSPRIWFITGCSSGLGLELVRHVLSKGDIAVATLRKPEVLADLQAQYPADRLLVLKVDVTVHIDIIAAFQKTKEVFGRLDVVVSNAGYAVLGEVEGTPDDVARALFEVNFWGSVHVMQEAVKFFREVNAPGKGGRIIQISSVMGIVGFPACGFYNATKFAIEGITEVLAKELDPAWNIKITDIPLGAFLTQGVPNMVKTDPLPAYTKPELASAQARKAMLASLKGEKDPNFEIKGDPAKAARAFYRLSEMESPPFRLVLGKDSLAASRAKISSFSAEMEEYAVWSEDIEID